MQRRLVIAVTLVAAACARESVGGADSPPATTMVSPEQPPQAGPPPALAAESAWTARSADGRIALVHAAAAGGTCSAVATDLASGAELWRSDACLGWRSDPVFVSARGDRALVLHAAAHAASGDWSSVVVASLFERGKLVRTFRGDELVHRDRIAAMRPEERWARGLDPADGDPPPGHEAGDRVRIETVDGQVVRIGFDGTVSASDPTAGAAGPAADDEDGLYRWTDDAGEVHYTNGAEIPAKYRSRAKPVRAQIGVVAVERISPGFAASRSSYAPARAAAPPAPAAPPRGWQPPREKDHFERIRELGPCLSGHCGGVKINQRPQVCTTKGDITECRDAK